MINPASPNIFSQDLRDVSLDFKHIVLLKSNLFDLLLRVRAACSCTGLRERECNPHSSITKVIGGSTHDQDDQQPSGGWDEFFVSDSMVATLTAFLHQAEDRVQLLGIHLGCILACLTPRLSKADGAGHAESLSGADGLAESISGVPEVYLE